VLRARLVVAVVGGGGGDLAATGGMIDDEADNDGRTGTVGRVGGEGTWSDLERDIDGHLNLGISEGKGNDWFVLLRAFESELVVDERDDLDMMLYKNVSFRVCDVSFREECQY
jgi:hypothetical protein